jgi:curli biogenesis system outer membrane secretion channel CsgG
MRKILKFSGLSIISVLMIATGCLQQVTRPEPKVTSRPGPTVEQVQYEPSWGPKKRIAVIRFENKTSYTSGGQFDIGTGMADQLTTALFQTGAFILLERQAIEDVMREQEFGATGRVKRETAAKIGQIEGAELLIYGAITEYDPGQSGAEVGTSVGEGASTGALIGGPVGALFGAVAGAVAGAANVKQAHVAIDLKIVDANTGRVVNATSVEGKPREVGGQLGIALSKVAFGSAAYYKTPIGQAVRDCINKGVDFIVKTAFPNYREDAAPYRPQPEVAVAPSSSPEPSLAPEGLKSQPEPVEEVGTIANCTRANIREGPGTGYRIIATLNRGTQLQKIEASGGWVKVKLDDGRIGWISGKLIE